MMPHPGNASLKDLRDAWEVPVAATLQPITYLGEPGPRQSVPSKTGPAVSLLPTRNAPQGFWSGDLSQEHPFHAVVQGSSSPPAASTPMSLPMPTQGNPDRIWQVLDLLPFLGHLTPFTTCILGPQSLHLPMSSPNLQLSLGVSRA